MCSLNIHLQYYLEYAYSEVHLSSVGLLPRKSTCDFSHGLLQSDSGHGGVTG